MMLIANYKIITIIIIIRDIDILLLVKTSALEIIRWNKIFA